MRKILDIDLRDGLVDVNPARYRIDSQIFWLLFRHGIRDGCIGAIVIIMCSDSEETGANHGVLPQEVCVNRDRNTNYFNQSHGEKVRMVTEGKKNPLYLYGVFSICTL